MANVFISFLGTNNYTRCNYFFSDFVTGIKKIEKIRFVQEALIEHLCANWTVNDKIFIFLTKDAETLNWNDGGQKERDGKVIDQDKDGYPLKGLKTQIAKMKLKASVIPVTDVPEGYSEKQIWEIFTLVQKSVEKEDTLWFDITFGFRSLPMLVMVLLQYLKTIKNIKVGGIYYGAFESLGKIKDVGQIPLDKRDAPVLNLTAFHNMQIWTAGADIFTNFGDAGRIREAIQQDCEKERNVQGRKIIHEKLNLLADSLEKTGLLFDTARGLEIYGGEPFEKVKLAVKELKNNNEVPAPLKPLLDTIHLKLNSFASNNIHNGFAAVKWCINHHLIQQGITLLQETIVSWLCELSNLDWEIENDRKLASQAIKIVAKNKPKDSWLNLSKKREAESKMLQSTIRNFKNLAEGYCRLSTLRNDINHGGCRNENDNKPHKAEVFKCQLEEIYESINSSISTTLQPEFA